MRDMKKEVVVVLVTLVLVMGAGCEKDEPAADVNEVPEGPSGSPENGEDFGVPEELEDSPPPEVEEEIF